MEIFLIVVLAIINLIIYHKIFNVYYFNLGKGLVREFVFAFMIAGLELAAIMIAGGWLLSIIAAVIPVLLVVFVVVMIVRAIRKNTNRKTENSSDIANCEEDLPKGDQGASVNKVSTQTSNADCIEQATEENSIAVNNASSTVDNDCLSFDVELTDAGSNKVKLMKETRELTGLGLKETKDMIDNTPVIIMCDVSEEEASKIKEKLELLGAKITVYSKEKSEEDVLFCVNCGAQIKKGINFCKYCGHKNENEGGEK